MQNVNPLVKQIGQLIDARNKTLEANIKAEIIASEKRSGTKIENLEQGIDAKIDNLEKKMDMRIENVEKKLEVIDDKLDTNIKAHEKRIKRLETHTGLATSTS